LISLISEIELETALKKFSNAQIECPDLAGNSDHWKVKIVDSIFQGQSRIQQHKMAQEAVIDYSIHTLSIKTAVK